MKGVFFLVLGVTFGDDGHERVPRASTSNELVDPSPAKAFDDVIYEHPQGKNKVRAFHKFNHAILEEAKRQLYFLKRGKWKGSKISLRHLVLALKSLVKKIFSSLYC